MPYSSFSLKDIEQDFGVEVAESAELFSAVPEVQPGPMLQSILQVYLPLAIAISTEKARSELLVAPVLVEVREQLRHQVSLFSGVDFTVDPERGLNGVCDFILTRSPQQLFIRAPAVAIVEAKNDNLKNGLGQCVAAMIGAKTFNEKENTPVPKVYGAVTTGTLWQFLQLAGTSVTLGQEEYHITHVAKILGILLHLLRN